MNGNSTYNGDNFDSIHSFYKPKKPMLSKETLLGIGVLAIAQGVNTLPSDLLSGSVITAVGLVILYARGYLKLQ